MPSINLNFPKPCKRFQKAGNFILPLVIFFLFYVHVCTPWLSEEGWWGIPCVPAVQKCCSPMRTPAIHTHTHITGGIILIQTYRSREQPRICRWSVSPVIGRSERENDVHLQPPSTPLYHSDSLHRQAAVWKERERNHHIMFLCNAPNESVLILADHIII